MGAITLLIHDDRYTIPTVRLLEAADAETALELGRRALAETEHHRGVELWRDDERLATLGAAGRVDSRRSSGHEAASAE